ncbi:hypothetical protein EX30DRAFT_77796 [Ascodesmis nigricans]|uniref:Yeast cell wall synthesis Kre9/Knh1-like N-terminal domain-containing protein n=1 Tax=Ascodesmis nigricans TaxID=341454 RepID=A0A4S2MQW3_9PEZI|nr:hypothetical protein EX30DRAFT_77796 [Ascodesmis nigricans]
MGGNLKGWWSFTYTLFLFVLLAVVSVTAQKQSGQNPITYPLTGIVGSDGTITIEWKPTTSGTITIELLKGPQINLENLGPILKNADNTGSFTWSVPKSLESYESMPKDYIYGFKIIDDDTKDYEYSNPFRIEVPGSTYGGGVAAPTKATAQPTPAVTAKPTEKTEKTEKPTETKKPEQKPVEEKEEEKEEKPKETTKEDEDVVPTAAFREVVTKTADIMAEATAPTSATTAAPLPPDNEPVNVFAIAGGVAAGVAVLIALVILFIRLKKDKNLIANQQTKTERRAIEADPESGSGTGAQLTEITGGHRRMNSLNFGDAAAAGKRSSEEYNKRDVIKPNLTEQKTQSPIQTTSAQVNFPPAAAAVAAVPLQQGRQQSPQSPQSPQPQPRPQQQYPPRQLPPQQNQWQQGGQSPYGPGPVGAAMGGRQPPPGHRGPPPGQRGPPPGQRGPLPAQHGQPRPYQQQAYQPQPRGPPAAYDPRYQNSNFPSQNWPMP